MKHQPDLNWLVPLITVLGLIAAGVGLFVTDSGSPFAFTTVHGQTVQMYGQGLYRYDTLQGGATFRGTDAVTLFVGIPFLVLSFLLYRRGSLKGAFLLTGALTFSLYNAASLALSAAYNNLFLVYIAYFSASLFALVLALTSIDLQTLPAHISSRFPHRGVAILLFIAGGATALIWLSDAASALITGTVPQALASYTTVITYVLDLGIITPVCILAGVLLLRRVPLGYLLAASMLILLMAIGLVVLGQTAIQLIDGIVLSAAQYIFYVGSFVVMTLFAIGLAARFFRNLKEA